MPGLEKVRVPSWLYIVESTSARRKLHKAHFTLDSIKYFIIYATIQPCKLFSCSRVLATLDLILLLRVRICTYSLEMASCMQTLSFFTLATLDLILLEGIISVPLVFLGTLPWIEYILLPFGRTWPLERHV